MPSGGLGVCQEFRQVPENQMKDGPGKKKAQGEAPLGSRRFANATNLYRRLTHPGIFTRSPRLLTARYLHFAIGIAVNTVATTGLRDSLRTA